MSMKQHAATHQAMAAEIAFRDAAGGPPASGSPIVSRVLEVGEQPSAFQSDAHAPEDHILPFLGSVKFHDPGRVIKFDRRLCLQEDLYLADHAFVYAPGAKPVSACLPVLPMTMSLEAMAEAAACLAPGEGLLGFEDVTATRWIELEDTDLVHLDLAAAFIDRDASGVTRVKASISTTAQKAPAIEATVLFGAEYNDALALEFSELRNARPFPQSGQELYAQRHMFHGPSFHCIHGDIVVADNGAIASFVVLPADALFSSTRNPQLLACPTLLDAVGQLIGVWALGQERFAFPIGLERLEIYSPTPPVGALTLVGIEITDDQGKMVQANIEIGDGEGGVWMRIRDWRSWKFKWPERVVNFRRLPHRYVLSRDAPDVASASGGICLTVADADLRGFDLELLARYYLNEAEMRRFKELKRFHGRQRQWLLGRVAAKDAIRKWIARKVSADDFLHPAAITLFSGEHNDERPRVAQSRGPAPYLSIAHCDDRAIAIAQSEEVGLDVERIEKRDATVLESYIFEEERQLLVAFPSEAFDASCTRLWCCKEAVAKLLGVGIGGLMKTLEGVRFGDNGEVLIQHRSSGRSYKVQSARDEDFIIACATQADSF